MIMPAGLRKVALAAHITFSVGLLGSIAAFLALAIAGLCTQHVPIIRSSYLAMDLITRYVLVPFAFASLITGVIQSFGTPWGLLRHYWVVSKLAITILATAVMLAKLDLIRAAAELASKPLLPSSDLQAAGLQLLVHAGLGLVVLLVPVLLSVYKPKGMTPFGLRESDRQLTGPAARASITGSRRLDAPLAGAITVSIRRAHLAWVIAVVIAIHILILHSVGFVGGLH